MNDLDDIRITTTSEDLDAMVVKAAGQIAHIDSEISISTLQDKIQQLQQQKSRLQAFTSHCTNLKIPISRLPAETLIEIFSYALPEAGVNIGCQRSLPEGKLDMFQLGSVCYSWRTLLLSQPLFWSKVALSLPHPEASLSIRAITNMYTVVLARLNHCYLRSGNGLMSLSMKTAGLPPADHERDLKMVFGRIAFGARRWRSIRFIGNLFEMPYQLGEVGYPNLRFLNLTDRSGNLLVVNRILQIFGPKTPALSTLHLALWKGPEDRGLTTFYETSLLSSIGSQVTDLTLVIAGTFWRPDVVHLRELVLLFPNIVKLKIHILATSWRPSPDFTLPQMSLSSIMLPNLTSLDLRWGSPAQPLSTFFFCLVPPELQHLGLEINGQPQGPSHDLLEWVEPFSSSLKSADLRWDTGQSSFVISSLLQVLGRVPKLSLRGPGAGGLFVILEAKDSSGQFQYMPNLTSLTLHPRLDTKSQFLDLISARTLDVYNDNASTASKLKHVRIYAPRHLIRDIQPILLSLIECTNYTFSVEYEVDHEPWLSLGRDGRDSQPTNRTLRLNFYD